jgi:hypothetical protein
MNDLDIILSEMIEQDRRGKMRNGYEAERFFISTPFGLDTIELFRDCPADIEKQVKEELNEAVWEYIEEALEYGKLAD